MLRFIKGGAGTGKSTLIKEEIINLLNKGENKILLIVPEQFSFETEKEYYNLIGAKYGENIKVLSFDRLADDVFSLYGNIAGNYATNTIELLTMQKALKECKNNLKIYKSDYIKPDLIVSMLNTAKEFKNASVPFDMLYKEVLKLNDCSLKDKLLDLSLIFESYEALLKQDFLDPEDILHRAKELISAKNYFKDTLVYFDEFNFFSGIQKKIIDLALKQAKNVTVSLCIPNEEFEYGLFSTIEEVEKSLKAMAFKSGCKVVPPVTANEPKRYLNPEISYFCKEALKNNPSPYNKENNAVSCVELLNEFDEVDFVASSIWELVQKNNYKFEDIVVIGRDFSNYGHIIESAFEKYNIPFFFDHAQKIDTMPLIRFVNHLLGNVVTRISRKELIPMLKYSILPFEAKEIDDFEKYIYIWNIDKDGFLKEFTQNPTGFSDRPLKRSEKIRLKNAEKVRKFCVELITDFKSYASEVNSISRAIYKTLSDLSLNEIISKKIENYKALNMQKEADDEKRVWDVLMEILDALETSLKTKELNFREYKELFSLSAVGYDLGHRPQVLDSVIVGSAERIRVNNKKAAIIIGANDKIFPYIPSSVGLLNDNERKIIAKEGIELYNFNEQKLINERFVAYKALSSPSEKIIITFSRGDISGHEKYPSSIVTGYEKIFPENQILKQKDIDKSYFCRNLPTLFYQVAKIGKNKKDEDAVFYATAKEFLKDDTLYSQKIKRLEKPVKTEDLLLSNSSLCTELFSKPLIYKGERANEITLPLNNKKNYKVKEKNKLIKLHKRTISVSPSQIESYYTCPFQYFCRYGLKLSAPRKAELNPLNRGNVIHYVLDNIIRNSDILTLNNNELKNNIDFYLNEYLNLVMGGENEKSQKFLYFYKNLCERLFNVISALKEEFLNSEFKVVGLEEAINQNSKITPIILKINDSNTITVSGKIDRVDCYTLGEQNFIRVIDYKSGKKEFNISQVAAGINLQMLLYLFAIWQTNNDKYKNVVPAGILYMPAKSPSPGLDRNATEQEQISAKKSQYTMKGILLEDEIIFNAMKGELSDNGKKNKAFVTLSQFKDINNYTYELVRLMGEKLLDGKITPDPVQTGQNPPCAFCDYKSVCGREISIPCREIPKKTIDDFKN